MERTVDDILELVQFTSESIAQKMIRTLNRILDIQGRVTISDLCDKMEIDISEEERSVFNFVLWKDRINSNSVYPIIKHEEISGYAFIFPKLYTEN